MNVSKSAKLVTPGYTLTFILVTSLFFLWALPNNLNDILIPQFMKSFELNRLEAGLVQSAFYLGYFVLAVPAALIMDKYGYKVGLVIGLLLFATGCFLFWPAALAGKYGFFSRGPFCDCRWFGIYGDRIKFIYCHFGRRIHFGTAFKPFPILQPAWINDRGTCRYSFHFFRN